MSRLLLTLAAAVAVTLTAVAQPRVIAHRGLWEAPGSAQNSLASLALADSGGAYGSEFDVWLTADDSLVVNHNQVFHGVDMPHATYAQARAVRLDNGEPLPSLDDYLTEALLHPMLQLILELKPLPASATGLDGQSALSREDRAAALVIDKLRQYGLLERTDVISFSLNACLAFKKLVPEGLDIYYLDGDLTPVKIHALGLAGIDYSAGTIKAHPQWIKEAHDLGLRVNVWTVDDPADIALFTSQGVDYITTNRPTAVVTSQH